MVLVLHCGERMVPAISNSPGVKRVVTLAPNLSEIVATIGCSGSIIATDDFSDYPPSLASVKKVGGVQPSVEAIAALRPDLVIASTEGSHPRLVETLGRGGIDSLLVSTATLREVEGAFSLIASRLRPCSSPAQADMFRASLAGERRERERRAKILYVVWTTPLYVAGRGNFLDDLFMLVGATNAVEENVTGWPQYSREALLADPPDIVLYSAKSVSKSEAEGLLGGIDPGHGVTFVGVDEDEFTRPGPRLVSAAKELNRILDAWERTQ